MSMLNPKKINHSSCSNELKVLPEIQSPCQSACMYCGKVRVAPRVWKFQNAIEKSRISHTACPDCYRIQIAHLFDEIHEIYGVVVSAD